MFGEGRVKDVKGRLKIMDKLLWDYYMNAYMRYLLFFLGTDDCREQ